MSKNFSGILLPFPFMSGEMRIIVKLLKKSTNNYSILKAFLRNFSHFLWWNLKKIGVKSYLFIGPRKFEKPAHVFVRNLLPKKKDKCVSSLWSCLLFQKYWFVQILRCPNRGWQLLTEREGYKSHYFIFLYLLSLRYK